MNRREFLQSGAVVGTALALPRHGALAALTPAQVVPPLIDLSPIVSAALDAVRRARIAPGTYRRWLGEEQGKRADGDASNPYGCADAANILYSLGHFPRDLAERAAFVRELRGFQRSDGGLFEEATHHPYHVTAHCVGALQLFDALPDHPLTALHFLWEKDALENFLAQLKWQDSPWDASHQGAGVYAALVMTEEVDLAWQDRYFSWLWEQQDPETGLWRKGAVETADTAGGQPFFHHLAGSFHYLFNYEYAHRPLHYPDSLIDSCLKLRAQNMRPTLGRKIGFAEIDWVFCLTRALRQSGHRFATVHAVLSQFAVEFAEWLFERIRAESLPFTDLHNLFGTVCALAELQTWLPGVYRTERPLHLVLDRRPFI